MCVISQDDLLAELEELEQEELDEQLLDVPTASHLDTLPTVPNQPLPAVSKRTLLFVVCIYHLVSAVQ